MRIGLLNGPGDDAVIPIGNETPKRLQIVLSGRLSGMRMSFRKPGVSGNAAGIAGRKRAILIQQRRRERQLIVRFIADEPWIILFGGERCGELVRESFETGIEDEDAVPGIADDAPAAGRFLPVFFPKPAMKGMRGV